MGELLGQTAREAREEAGLRQLDIATTASVSHVTVSKFERGQAWPHDIDQLIAAYAEELGCEPVELWERALDRWRT